MLWVLYLLLQGPNFQRAANTTNPANYITLQYNCTSRDISTCILITSSAAPHPPPFFFYQHAILRQMNMLTCFWMNSDLSTHGCTLISRFTKKERWDLSSVWYIVTLNSSRITMYLGHVYKTFSYKIVPQITEE